MQAIAHVDAHDVIGVLAERHGSAQVASLNFLLHGSKQTH